MLDKTIIEFILLLKSKYNTKYSDNNIRDRIKHFISETYRLDEVSDWRILLELKYTFLDVIPQLNSPTSRYFVERFLKMEEENGKENAYIDTIRSIQVKDDNDYINGFWDISKQED